MTPTRKFKSCFAAPIIAQLCFSMCATASAAAYYVDSIAGKDSNAGTSDASAWKTIAQVNTALINADKLRPSILPGDTVYFKSGSVWDEQLLIRRSGSSSALPITFKAYGATGDKPTIRASKPILGTWSPTENSKIWKISIPVDIWQLALSTSVRASNAISQVGDNNATVLPFAHYPNIDMTLPSGTDMMRVQSPVACSDVVGATADDNFNKSTCALIHEADDGLAAHANDMVGADIIIRDGQYSFDRRRVLSYDAGTKRVTWVSARVNTAASKINNTATYPLVAGYAFYAAGKKWMIDQPGEWAVETTTVNNSPVRTLYLQTVDGKAPASGAIRYTPVVGGWTGPAAIDAANQKFVVIDGLQTLDGATGLDVSSTESVKISNVGLSRSVFLGVLADNASNLSLDKNSIDRTGFQAIHTTGSTKVSVTNSEISKVGTHLPPNGDVVSNMNYYGFFSLDADKMLISGNNFSDLAYIGAFLGPNRVLGNLSTVENNSVQNVCLYLDDCGALYTSGRTGQNTGVNFVGNFIKDATGNPIGRPKVSGQFFGSSAQGIYLDDYAKSVTVDRNVVVNADHGVVFHLARNNSVVNNLIAKSRQAGTWFQEEQKGIYDGNNVCADIDNCIVNNSLQYNAFIDLPNIPSHLLDSGIGDTIDFSSFNHNTYSNIFTGFSAVDHSTIGGQSKTDVLSWPTWQFGKGNDRDGVLLAGSLAAYSSYASKLGLNLLPNGDFANDVAGWTYYLPAGTKGSLIYAGGGYARFQAGASTNPDAHSAAYTTGGFTVTAGKTYLVRFAARGANGNVSGYGALRHNSDAVDGIAYTDLAAHVPFVATGDWQYFYALLTATGAANGANGSGKARLDLEVLPGSLLEFDDVLVSEFNATPVPVPAASLVQVFLGGPKGAGQYACPSTGVDAARCSSYVDLQSGKTITWPLTVAKNDIQSTVVAVAMDSQFLDTDGDGVADVNDSCSSTPAGVKVDERGCSYVQRHSK